MNAKNEKGRNCLIAMAAYVIIKAVLNMILAGGFSLSRLFIALGTACLFFIWIKKFNYVIAAILAIVVLVHLPANLAHIGSNWIYLLEGVIDIVCAVLLVTNEDIKENFSGTINFS